MIIRYNTYMKTFTQMKSEVAQLCGLDDSSDELVKIAKDICSGAQLVNSLARRYPVTKIKTTDLIAKQTSYQLSDDVLRITAVTCRDSELIEIKSTSEYVAVKHNWLTLASQPTYYFVKTPRQIEILPPSAVNVTDGLKVIYEAKAARLHIDDYTVKVKIETNSDAVEAVGGDKFRTDVVDDCYMIFSDERAIKIDRRLDDTHLLLQNYYEGDSSANTTVTIGQSVDIPEEYHDAIVYYACQQFYLMRKDLQTAGYYKQLYDELVERYRTTYGLKTSDGVINPYPRLPVNDPRVSPWRLNG